MKPITEAEGRLPYRSFVIANLGYEFYRREGFGLTLEQAIEREVWCLKDGYKHDVDAELTGEQYVVDSMDTAIYEGRRIAAVLHLRADGQVIVTRIGPEEKEPG